MATVSATTGLDNFDGLSNTTAGNDTINAANGTANAGDVWNGGAGTDILQLVSNGVKLDLSVVDLSGIESLLAGRRNDTITIGLADFSEFTSINGGKGKDTLNVAVSGGVDISAAALTSLTALETIKLTGSSAADNALLTGAQLDKFSSIALGGGADTIRITSTSIKLNTLSDTAITGVEKISAAPATSAVTINLGLQTEAFVITGSANADNITGGRAADTLGAGNGDDTINVAASQFVSGESIDGGLGTDAIQLNATGVTVDFSLGTLTGIENLTGGIKNDIVTLSATQLADFASIDLGVGSDILNTVASGNISSLTLPGMAGIETANLVGTASNESLTLTGAALNSLVTANGSIELGDGNDIITLLSTSSTLNAIGTNDLAVTGVETISAESAAAGVTITLSGQKEALTVTGSDNADTVTGGIGADSVAGGLGNDNLQGSGGNDILNGGGGADTIDGGDGNDTVTYAASSQGVKISLKTGKAFGGTAEGDIVSTIENIIGTSANDRLTGDAFANALTAGSGNDSVEGGAGADILTGGDGKDTVSYKSSTAAVIVNLATNNASGGDAAGDVLSAFENLTGSKFADNLTGTARGNIITGGNGNDSLFGGNGKDRMLGGNGNDTIDGGGGSDTISGSNGADTLSGGAGSDKMTGGSGKDSLAGGSGSDKFIFTKLTEAGKGALADTLTDFLTKTDKIDLSGIDANSGLDGNQAFKFIGAQAFTNKAGELHYDKATGLLSGDIDADGNADFNLHLGAGTIVVGIDFIL